VLQLLHPTRLIPSNDASWLFDLLLHPHDTPQYAEAHAFLVFLSDGRLVKAQELPLVEPEEYLGGVLDMTGEGPWT
jgi:hypothetical protein